MLRDQVGRGEGEAARDTELQSRHHGGRDVTKGRGPRGAERRGSPEEGATEGGREGPGGELWGSEPLRKLA